MKTIIDFNTDCNTLYVTPLGTLDNAASEELKEQIVSEPMHNANIDMDLEHVDYISSAGLRLLVALNKQANGRGRSMVIRNTGKVVDEIFRISGFNKAFNVI